ncbi:MAG: glycosyl hydrolase [Flavobacteriales bacterium]|nr:glycosyl hydrolase [Flavobacteriales bacterium]MBK9698648.1 glycosyl hydrolase [Flavobacteriales bacterium]
MIRALLLAAAVALSPASAHAQRKPARPATDTLKADQLSGLTFRSIGPAFMSGRIADVVIHPTKPGTWYVAVGSGGVWKTVNAGTTWTPLFDGQASYSIGCITLDPQDPEVVWVGTGENVAGRHVGFGDGVYRSADGGKTWKHMGLKTSEHISRIVVHPTDPNTVWVAAQGPLWTKGGERGVYRTTDGGKTWKRTLGDEAWVGATDLVMDPRDPKRLYAATWQRHRTVAGYMGGGPGSAIHRSTDGGETWTKLEGGLPGGNLGKIGLALSPQRPDVLYAAIELDRRTGAVYRSADRGASWTKMSDAVSGGTGPHYYQELYTCPHQFDRLYLVSNTTQTSDDGGKTFRGLNVDTRHVDDHVVVFHKDDPEYLLFGCDGGLYETFDRGGTWRHIGNLPVTQFYKVAVDDELPFYTVYGGTQDNNTQGGPSRTDNEHGIRSSDWSVIIGGDGHQPATEPGNPDIVYGQWQQGNLMRHDRRTGENVYIRPQAAPGEPWERSNWDAPIVVSPHDPATLYFGTYRVWRSTDRGDSWTALSGDLTSGTERIRTNFYGTTQGWDNPWDLYAMSEYATITSLAVSPVQKGLLYAGTDDGAIQVTEDEGKSWRRVPFSALPGLPATAFVNDIKADLFDAGTVYAAFDDHKNGVYKPFLYRSADKGRTWISITGDLPQRTLVWRVVQDDAKRDLLFLGTEFGVYVTTDGGKRWFQLKGGLPNIPVRDLAIHRREHDLVVATFGRGFYILDDYRALRELNDAMRTAEATLFEPRSALWYSQRSPLGGGRAGSMGDAFFTAPNPPFGAELTYHLKEAYKSRKDVRKELEQESTKAKQPLSVPAWDSLEAELRAQDPKVWLVVTDAAGNVVRRVEASNAKGFQRVVWDLRADARAPVTPGNADGSPAGSLVAPGLYGAQLFKQVNGALTAISARVDVRVEPLMKGTLPGAAPEAVAEYARVMEELYARNERMEQRFQAVQERGRLLLAAYTRAPRTDEALHRELLALRDSLQAIDLDLNGSRARSMVGEERFTPGLRDFLGNAGNGGSALTYGPTATHHASRGHAERLLADLERRVNEASAKADVFETRVQALGAPALKER